MGIFDCASLWRTDELAGCLKHRSDKTERGLALYRLGSADGACDLRSVLVIWRPCSVLFSFSDSPLVPADRRCPRGIYHRSVVKGMDRLGPARATLTIVVTQILVSYGIELFGLFGVEKVPFEWRRLLGAGIAIAGIVIFHL